MVNYSVKDLEMILSCALNGVSKFGVEPSVFERLYRAAVKEVTDKKAGDVVDLYSSFQPHAFYIESFQSACLSRNREVIPKESIIGSTNLTSVTDCVNRVFGTNISWHNPKEGNVYVWLERDPLNKGVLRSYGCAHEDRFGRSNYHNVFVTGDFNELSLVVDTFLADPKNMPVFDKIALGWDSEKKYYPHLYKNMKELCVHTPAYGHKFVRV